MRIRTIGIIGELEPGEAPPRGKIVVEDIINWLKPHNITLLNVEMKQNAPSFDIDNGCINSLLEPPKITLVFGASPKCLKLKFPKTKKPPMKTAKKGKRK